VCRPDADGGVSQDHPQTTQITKMVWVRTMQKSETRDQNAELKAPERRSTGYADYTDGSDSDRGLCLSLGSVWRWEQAEGVRLVFKGSLPDCDPFRADLEPTGVDAPRLAAGSAQRTERTRHLYAPAVPGLEPGHIPVAVPQPARVKRAFSRWCASG
jgi:hypothetical protein